MPALLAMSAAMHAESPHFRAFRYSEEKMFNIISLLMRDDTPGGVFVACNNDGVIGMLGFTVAEHFFSPDKVSMDVGIYVKPESRGGTSFARLVHAYEVAAGEHGVFEKGLGVNTGVHMQKTVAMLERLGYEVSGVNLRKVST